MSDDSGAWPVFDVAQFGGTRASIDLSVPGETGDFAFRVTGARRERGGSFFAYYVYEAAIFVDVLRAMPIGGIRLMC